jgi:stage IV sporulation protein FB
MDFQIKLFDFQGVPVYLKLWFLLLFAWLPFSYVVAIFISILVHELAHTYVANRLGYYVSKVYIGLFNGAAEMNLSQIHERDSIKIVAAGPLSNLLLFFASLIPISMGYSNQFITDFANVNLLLLIFNIIPIYPLDGGRLLRDGLYLIGKNRKSSVMISSSISLLLSSLLLVYAIVTMNIFAGIFAGLFIYFAVKELGWIKNI